MAELNPGQKEAAEHMQGPLLVLAGAGSGKTRVVTHRISHLLEIGVSPREILAVTFTNKAAEEMRSRIEMLNGQRVLACTFHSLGARILRESIHFLNYEPNFSIYDTEDSEKILKTCFKELGFDLSKATLKEMRNKISATKNDLLDPDEIKEDSALEACFSLYQKKLQACQAVDFDDLLYLPVKLFRENEEVLSRYQERFQFVLIDEYQDTNMAQYTLTKLLVCKHQNIFAVGDPDQSIYSWRGARYQNILNFESDFPGAKVITLDQNYRSTNNILSAANALICHNDRKFKKELWSDLGDGEEIGVYIGYNEREEAQFVASRIERQYTYEAISYDEMAIFYRTNAQSRPFEDALLSKRIPYTIIGGLSFYERKEIKDILAYLRLLVSNSDQMAFARTIHIPKRGLGQKTVEKLIYHANEHELPILTFCEELLERPLSMSLTAKQKTSLQEYLKSLHRLRNLRNALSLQDLIKELLAEISYFSYLALDIETEQDRKENIDELLSKAMEWEEDKEEPTLELFLEELSLHIPQKQDPFVPTVKLMTLHNSKGLEFPLVFLVGMEEDLLPHINSKEDYTALEEERRLCYVGMTRAKKKLYLTAARFRYMWGSERMMRLSRFLGEVPEEYTMMLSQKVRPRY